MHCKGICLSPMRGGKRESGLQITPAKVRNVLPEPLPWTGERKCKVGQPRAESRKGRDTLPPCQGNNNASATWSYKTL